MKGPPLSPSSHTGCVFSRHLKSIRCTWLAGEGAGGGVGGGVGAEAVPSSIHGSSGQTDGLQKLSKQDTTKFKNKSKTHKSLQETGLFGATDKPASTRLDFTTE